MLALIAIICLSNPLWQIQLRRGTLHWTGPLDDLIFGFFILLPWLFFTSLNVVFLIRDLFARRKAVILLIQCVALLIWAAMNWHILFLVRAPEGVEYMGQ